MAGNDKLSLVLAAVSEINFKLTKITSDTDKLTSTSGHLEKLFSSLHEKMQANDQKHEERWRDVVQRLAALETRGAGTEAENSEVVAREVEEVVVRELEGELDKALDKAKSELTANVNRALEAMDNAERMKKKLNLVISGLVSAGCTGEVGVRRILSEKFNLVEEIKGVELTGKSDKAVVKVDCWDTRVKILKSKGEALSHSKVFIDPDLTVREQRNAAKLREVARAKRADGLKARAINQRLQVGSQWFKWDECNAGILRCQPPVHRKDDWKWSMSLPRELQQR